MGDPAGHPATGGAEPEQQRVGDGLDAVVEFHESTGNEDCPAAQLADAIRRRSAGLRHAGETSHDGLAGSDPSDER